jgi:hypothetical protein
VTWRKSESKRKEVANGCTFRKESGREFVSSLSLRVIYHEKAYSILQKVCLQYYFFLGLRWTGCSYTADTRLLFRVICTGKTVSDHE